MTFAQYPSLAGRVVFVTGGATGIGADIVEAFAGQDAKVAFVDLQTEAGEALADRLAAHGAPRPMCLAADVTNIPSLQAAIARVKQTLGPIGVLVNNAANDQRHKVDEVSVEFWDQTQDVNLRHQFFAAQAVRAAYARARRRLDHQHVVDGVAIRRGGDAGVCDGQGWRARADAGAGARIRSR